MVLLRYVLYTSSKCNISGEEETHFDIFVSLLLPFIAVAISYRDSRSCANTSVCVEGTLIGIRANFSGSQTCASNNDENDDVPLVVFSSLDVVVVLGCNQITGSNQVVGS